MTTDHDPDRFDHLDHFEGQPMAVPPPPRPRVGRWVALIVGAVALIAGAWLVATRLPGWLAPSGDVTVQGGTQASEEGESRRIQATLFYPAEDGMTLVPTSRNVLYGATPAEQAKRLVEAQIAPPPDGLVSAIPTGTTVRAVFVTDAQEAYVDLGGDIVSGHSGGSLDEALAVYAIVNAVTVNLPEIKAVQILIDGNEVDSLRGHIDLRAPLARAPEWIQKGPATP